MTPKLSLPAAIKIYHVDQIGLSAGRHSAVRRAPLKAVRPCSI